MKAVLFSLLFITVSCGQGNKSGNLAVPLIPQNTNPYITADLPTFLIGQWVEADGCKDSPRRRGRNSNIKVRYEVRFSRSQGVIDNLTAGKITYGQVEYDGSCQPERELTQEPNAEIYRLRGNTLEISESLRGPFESIPMEIKSATQMTLGGMFKNRQLVKISSQPLI